METKHFILYKNLYDYISDIGFRCVGEEKRVQGTVRSFRVQSGIVFVELFDSSTSAVLQLISEDASIVRQLDGSISNGASLFVKGVVRLNKLNSLLLKFYMWARYMIRSAVF